MKLTPSVTLTALKANNTSASSSFKGSPDGNAPPANISTQRLDLAPGAQVFAHYMPWWGSQGHISIGYDSSDPAQAERTAVDVKARGWHGFMPDYYGPQNTHHEKATLALYEACKRHGLLICIQEDLGAIKDASDKNAKMIADLTYILNVYAPANYLRWHERPVIMFFGVDGDKTKDTRPLDWPKIRAAIKGHAQGNPQLIFRQKSGLTHPESDGQFAWIGGNPAGTDVGIGYLEDMYNAGKGLANKLTIGSIYKGFNNTHTPWKSSLKVCPQRSGQTWLDTIAVAKKYGLQIIAANTWNDYEESSEIETGIDGSGNPNAVNHLEYYASLDGDNLMPITQEQLATLDPGTYKVFTRQVMHNSIHNVMVQGVDYVVPVTVTPPPLPPQPPPKPLVTIEVSVPAAARVPGTVPVPIGATASDQIDHWEIWLDSVKAQQVAAQKLSVDVPMKAGTHRVVVRAVTKDGGKVDEVRSVNVQ